MQPPAPKRTPRKTRLAVLQQLRVISLGMATTADSQKFASLREHEERRINETGVLRAANDRMIAYLMNISIAMCLGYAFRGDLSLLSGLEIAALLVMLLAGAAPSAVFFFSEWPREKVEFFEMYLEMEQYKIEKARFLAAQVRRENAENNLRLARRWRRICLLLWSAAMSAAILLVAVNAAVN